MRVRFMGLPNAAKGLLFILLTCLLFAVLLFNSLAERFGPLLEPNGFLTQFAGFPD
jgi:hypothetical protein